MPDILEAIEKKIGEVRTDALDLSFGELISLYANNEFVITPDYQRLFRWSAERSSRLVESILLELPVPQIYVIENQDGTLELIDGLQRLSSIIHFIQPDLLPDLGGEDDDDEPRQKGALKLEGCELIPELNGLLFTDLPTTLKLRVKRSSVRVVVIKRQSSPYLRYEMFKRLNTGGIALSEQEVRNCIARMVGQNGVDFYRFIEKCAKRPSFVTCTSTVPDNTRKKRGDEELVLRFFALKNGRAMFRGSVTEWLNEYMEAVIFGRSAFDVAVQEADFGRLFDYLNAVLGEDVFVRFRGQKPIGALAPAHFEAITLGAWNAYDHIKDIDRARVKQVLIDTTQTAEFKTNVGSGSNALHKFNGRISSIENALKGIKP